MLLKDGEEGKQTTFEELKEIQWNWRGGGEGGGIGVGHRASRGHLTRSLINLLGDIQGYPKGTEEPWKGCELGQCCDQICLVGGSVCASQGQGYLNILISQRSQRHPSLSLIGTFSFPSSMLNHQLPRKTLQTWRSLFKISLPGQITEEAEIAQEM